MDRLLYYLCIPFGYLMKGCFMLCGNYGVAVILFTLATKLLLMPLSVWIQKNSILMVKIQPEINYLKANMQGNLDAIADGQAKIFKRAHYHPMLSLIPLILQVVLLLAVVYIIYHPLGYLFGLSDGAIEGLAAQIGANTGDSSVQLQIIDAIKAGTLGAGEHLSAAQQARIAGFRLTFCGMNLTAVPSKVWGWYVLVPLLAGASSWALCFTQNLSNVLQREQGKLNKYGIMGISVALSLYLGLFVPSGIALYWIASNAFSIAIMYLLNALINPKKYVDYEELENSRTALAAAKEYGKIDKNDPDYKASKKKQKQDYKRFKGIVNKHVVFYSEKSGFYKYFKDVINELLARSNLTIHYVTNDYHDAIFELAKTEPRIKPYYISLKKTVLLMMLVECDMFLMTTPDLNKFYLKRSYMKKDVEYVYLPHDMMSMHMGFRQGAFDAFDTIFCTGPHQIIEHRETEKLYNLPQKTLVEFGYPLSDGLTEAGQAANVEREKHPSPVKEILIAPSWQEDNLLDSCIDTLIEQLCVPGYRVTVRPHPEYVKRFGYRMNALLEKYRDYDDALLHFETDFATSKSIYTADLLITDWSGVAPEYCFATRRPAIFVNTKLKCLNPEYEKIPCTPVEISLRSKLGVALDLDALDGVRAKAEELFAQAPLYEKQIAEVYKNFVFNQGTAAKAGAQYILKSLASKKKKAPTPVTPEASATPEKD